MTDGCDCTELCSMGPTCPGGMLARLPGSGCWRSDLDCAHCGGQVEPVEYRGWVYRCPTCNRLSITGLGQLRRPTVAEARKLYDDPIIRSALNLRNPITGPARHITSR